MKKQRITSPHVNEPPEGTWSNCLVIGDHIHVAGLTAGGMSDDLDSVGVYEQAKEIFTRIKHLIDTASSQMDDIVRVQIYVTDIRVREEVWKARREFFTGDFPALGRSLRPAQHRRPRRVVRGLYGGMARRNAERRDHLHHDLWNICRLPVRPGSVRG
ncbi:MAG: RidA family protein [Rickettsiales bacterium]